MTNFILDTNAIKYAHEASTDNPIYFAICVSARQGIPHEGDTERE